MNTKKEQLLLQCVQNILHEIEEGVHIIDDTGRTVLYNQAMEAIEGLEQDKVVGKHLLDVYPGWAVENSTLLMSQRLRAPITKDIQNYVNFEGRSITTKNITFPVFDPDQRLIGSIEIAKNYTNVSRMSDQIQSLQTRIASASESQQVTEYKYYQFDDIIGRDKELLKAVRYAKKAAESDSSVLIQGETGTGKELFAQSIHSSSKRRNKPFIAQNCAALPDTLLEGILFGTTKGSFTGAENKAGLLEQANGGTLFLDEINSMSEALQAKLLRVLQEGYVRRVGGNKDIHIDVRVIAASNVDLLQMLKENKFRKDLFYRINVIHINIPALRERKEDIPLFIDYFIRYYNKHLGKDVWMIANDLKELFMTYSWRGNVRELKNFIESSMNLIDDEHVVTREHLPGHMEDLLGIKRSIEDFDVFEDFVHFSEDDDLNAQLEKLERALINRYLKRNHGNLSKTAIQLKISRQNLQYKLKKFGIEASKSEIGS